MSKVVLSIHDGEIFVVGCPPEIDTIIIRDYDCPHDYNGATQEIDEDGEKFITICIPTKLET